MGDKKKDEELLAAIGRVAAVAARHAVEVDRGAFPEAAIGAAREAGLLGLTVATEMGGKGQGLRAAARVVEGLAGSCGSTAMVLCMHYSGVAVLERLAPEAIRRAVAGSTLR